MPNSLAFNRVNKAVATAKSSTYKNRYAARRKAVGFSPDNMMEALNGVNGVAYHTLSNSMTGDILKQELLSLGANPKLAELMSNFSVNGYQDNGFSEIEAAAVAFLGLSANFDNQNRRKLAAVALVDSSVLLEPFEVIIECSRQHNQQTGAPFYSPSVIFKGSIGGRPFYSRNRGSIHAIDMLGLSRENTILPAYKNQFVMLCWENPSMTNDEPTYSPEFVFIPEELAD